MVEHTESEPKGWLWLAATIPVLLVGAFVIGSGNRAEHDPNCLPNMPSAPKGTSPVVWPVTAGADAVTSPFGDRPGGFHKGADFGVPLRTPIYSATDGRVVAAGHADGFGNWIVVDSTIDGEKVSAVYGHMFDDGVFVRVNDIVHAGGAQPIAEVGNDGESSGPHLHFEIVPGGRLSGGTAIDPIPWLIQHAGPTQPATGANSRLAANTASTSEAEMPALPASTGSEDHLQIDTIRLVRAIAVRFPQIKSIGGWRPVDDFPDHPNGQAADIMVPNWDTPDGKALGDAIADYIMDHRNDFHLTYIIWRQEYRPATGVPNMMEEREANSTDPIAKATANHFNHVHATVAGGGYPQPGQHYGPAPEKTSKPASGCDTSSAPAAGSAVTSAAVPAAFLPWIAKAASTCPEVTQALLAAQLENESGFRTEAYNATSGAVGPAQFLPKTWDQESVDGDGDGRRDPRSIPDAVMSQASYDCKLATVAKTALAEGNLHGDLTQLWLSMYNCGPGNTLASGGVCRNPETVAYVANIPRRASELAAATAGKAS
ncbi:peptidoglycan DD-metalloendopeptidase family protein [Nocardia sp. NPDC050630]|uniref:peptidoglycan DD-metalloendopeptidase family protein n=1 Tax=Nocardia sp. NPDC050630 TaxID=3364321 RepID=UPI0037950AF1